MASGNNKEGLQYLQAGLNAAPRLVKKFIELNPSILQNNTVVDMLAQYKKKKKDLGGIAFFFSNYSIDFNNKSCLEPARIH